MVVVLGSTGYIGSAFIRALKAREIPHCTVARGQVDHFCADSLARHLKAVDAYNAAGEAFSHTDPAAMETREIADAMGRTITNIEN